MEHCTKCEIGTSPYWQIREVFSLGHGGIANEIRGRRNFSSHCRRSMLKITEESAFFRSDIDRTKDGLILKISIQVQRKLGADIVLAFNECTRFQVDHIYTALSKIGSHRCELRLLAEFKKRQRDAGAVRNNPGRYLRLSPERERRLCCKE
jgi:tRNA-guanine family transglycosylase